MATRCYRFALIAWHRGHHGLLFLQFFHINRWHHVWTILVANLVVRKRLGGRCIFWQAWNVWWSSWVQIILILTIILLSKCEILLLKLLTQLHDIGLHHLNWLNLLLKLKLHHVLVHHHIWVRIYSRHRVHLLHHWHAHGINLQALRHHHIDHLILPFRLPQTWLLTRHEWRHLHHLRKLHWKYRHLLAYLLFRVYIGWQGLLQICDCVRRLAHIS